MNKPYHNKALPPGTILREWRLEDVLGVGGFGIVYRGRGIYFNELVAIKEYFPSSISERDAEDTVVAIDSDAEEVHALGLKKFVEEAKLLWNLSTPTRHPNIVSVRSLFEVHGTAYMVMDFEDGMSLSKMLKQGRRFNERSLFELIRPIAEGLDRAHRVGVLHRDIKPPNILVNENGRSVLIDFGSARFESGEATSTTVTFHTPPYAAIEQYVKNYEQGPWTDIYALGVVLYECIAGEKPPEVLERLHGSAGQPLAGRSWPGYGETFLAAVDAAMIIKPSERPQSISDWLAMFDETGGEAGEQADDGDATRIVSYAKEAEQIVPVAPLARGFSPANAIKTGVPANPSAARFKRAGQESTRGKASPAAAAAAGGAVAAVAGAAAAAAGTGSAATRRRKASAKAAPASGETLDRSPQARDVAGPAVAAPASAKDAVQPAPGTPAGATPAAAAKADGKPDAQVPAATKRNPVLLGGVALAVLVAGVAGWSMLGIGGNDSEDVLVGAPVVPVAGVGATTALASAQGLEAAMQALVNDARTAGAPALAATRLDTAREELARMFAAAQPVFADPAQSAAANAQLADMTRVAIAANAEFSDLLLRDMEVQARGLSGDVPWADPLNADAASGEPADRQAIATGLRNALTGLRSTVAAIGAVTDPNQAIAGARQALGQSRAFASASSAAYRLRASAAPAAVAAVEAPVVPVAATKTPKAAKTVAPVKTATAKAPAVVAQDTALSPAKKQQLNAIVDEGRSMAKQVIRLGSRRAGSSPAERKGYETRQANAKLARGYEKYLGTLKDSMRGVETNAVGDKLIVQANQTKAYLTFLLKQSSAAP